MRIVKEIQIDAGHRVPTHTSKCRYIHGHRYRIIAELTALDVVPDSERAPDSGMVVDFGVLKHTMCTVIEEMFDHKLLLWEEDELLELGFAALLNRGAVDAGVVVLPCIPTAENLARYWFDLLDLALRVVLSRPDIRLTALTVFETPTSCAEYRP